MYCSTYLQTVGISGSAAISGWGQSSSVHGNYLNQAKVSCLKFPTYIVVVRLIFSYSSIRTA